MTNKHCPGFETNKAARPINVTCPNCGAVKEIFSDEIDKKQVCKKCEKPIDMSKAKIEDA